MQKALIVKDDRAGTSVLNEWLEDDWKVIYLVAMPTSTPRNSDYTDHKGQGTCLVIIEKLNIDDKED